MVYSMTVEWRVKRGAMDDVVELLKEIAPLTRAEEGNLFYAAQISETDPQEIVLYEQYVDESAYEAHRNTDHFRDIVLVRVKRYLDKHSHTGYTLIEA